MTSSSAKAPVYVTIMAGGVGSRFWPASREARPKQFLDILGTGNSLLQLTYQRFRQLVPAEQILVVTNARYSELVLEQLPELKPDQVLGEPSRNNTAPCIAYAAYKLQALDPEARMVVAPSDHLILKEAEFLSKLQTALDFTERENALVTLGIRPTRPDTGYGYIRFDPAGSEAVKKVITFTEKPPLEKAKSYLADGHYLWNAGLFIWQVADVLEAFSQHAPEIHRILGEGKGLYGSSQEAEFIQRAYPTTPSISVDYAILEKAENVYTLPADIGWSDLGTWASLHANAERDADQNLVSAEPRLLSETSDSLIRAPKDKLVVVKGLENYIVVDEEDVLLIWPKSEEQGIKQATATIREKLGERYL